MKWIIAILLVANAAWGYLIPQTGEPDVDGITLVIGAEINKPDGEDPRELIKRTLDPDVRPFETCQQIADAIKATEVSPEFDDQEGRWKRAKDAVKDWEDRLAIARAFKDELAKHTSTAAVYLSLDPSQYQKMPDPFEAIQTLLDDFDDRIGDIMATDQSLLPSVADSLQALRRNADQYDKGFNKDVGRCWGILIGEEGKHPEWWDNDVKVVALAAEAKNPLRTAPAIATTLPAPIKEGPTPTPTPAPTPAPAPEINLAETGTPSPPEEKYGNEVPPPEITEPVVATEVSSEVTPAEVTSPETTEVVVAPTEAPPEEPELPSLDWKSVNAREREFKKSVALNPASIQEFGDRPFNPDEEAAVIVFLLDVADKRINKEHDYDPTGYGAWAIRKVIDRYRRLENIEDQQWFCEQLRVMQRCDIEFADQILASI